MFSNDLDANGWPCPFEIDDVDRVICGEWVGLFRRQLEHLNGDVERIGLFLWCRMYCTGFRAH